MQIKSQIANTRKILMVLLGLMGLISSTFQSIDVSPVYAQNLIEDISESRAPLPGTHKQNSKAAASPTITSSSVRTSVSAHEPSVGTANPWPLPVFKLPYDRSEMKVFWSGGPHEYGDLNTQSTFLQGYGSGMDFVGENSYSWCNSDCSFIVRSMAEGEVIFVGEGSFGKQVAVRHTVGGSVIIYGHLYDFFPGLYVGYHVLQGSSIGHAGKTNTTNVHLHIELRDGNQCNHHCVQPNGLGGNPLQWHSVVIDGYRIFEYRESETEIAKVYNYDGVAVRETTEIYEYYPFPYIDSYFPSDPDHPPTERDAWTFLPIDFPCTSTTNCEVNNLHPDVEFSGHGEFGGGGALVSTNTELRTGLYTTTPVDLWQINPDTEELFRIGPTGYVLTDIAFDGQALYGITFSHLMSVNPATGASNPIGYLGYNDVNALTVGPDGTMYAGTGGGALLRINKSTGGGTLIGYYGSGLGSGGDIAILNNTMYASIARSGYSTDWLARINMNTGRATLIGDMGQSGVCGMDFQNGVLYGVTCGNGYLLTINTTTGAGTVVNEFSEDFLGLSSAPASCPTITDWKGEYWNNPYLSGAPPLCRNDAEINFDWGEDSPDPSISSDNFSARWTRTFDFTAGTYRLYINHDDGARLYIDDELVGDFWDTCCGWDSVDVQLSAGVHTIRLDYAENGGLAFSQLWWESINSSGTSIIPADFDGDRDTDVAIYRRSQGIWYVKDQFITKWGIPGDIPVPGDYNGDGYTDLAVYRRSQGLWYVRSQFNIKYGIAGDIPMPGDYDGDGDTDVAIYRPSQGIWYIRGHFITKWGIPGDIPMPGDYDGDGDTDLAIYRPSQGMWYVKDQFIRKWGVPGDIPVPGDYDGDGDTDLAIYRPSQGMWYVKDQFIMKYGLSTDFPLPVRDTNGDGDPYQ